jgi:hypothetical protein
MKLGRLAVLAALAACLAVAVGGTASAVPEGKWDAQVLGNVQIDPNDPTVAYVTARYVCSGESPHLWVSVKQAESRGPDNLLKEEGSSGYAVAWSQSHPSDQVVCDGTWHTDTFTVDQTEVVPWSPVPVGFGTLVKGQAYVQFCLIDNENEANFGISQRFAAIR